MVSQALSTLTASLAAPLRSLGLGRARRAPRGWVWLLLVAVLLRGLIPVGYMINTDGGPAPFMLCPDVHDGLERMPGMASVEAPASPGHFESLHQRMHHHHPGAAGDMDHRAMSGTPTGDMPMDGDPHRMGALDHMGPCAFAALAALVVPLLLLVLALPTRQRQRQTWRPTADRRHRHLRLPGTPGARAPPLAA
ncbi:MAG: hypothetical protein PW843_26670 [Azospirillaceae bacterium]|nr:hypothetical protein [Azospirillaceae bacterium]